LSTSLYSYSNKHQNAVSDKYFVLTGRFQSMNMKIVLEVFMTTYHISIGVEYSVDPSNTSGGLYLKIKDI
jgi:hypothetical protein